MKIELERPISFFPQLSKLFGGIKEAVYYQQLYYWSDKGHREDKWIYKTKDEIERETTLSREEQDRIRKKLEKMGYIQTKVMKVGNIPTIHYLVTDGKVEITRFLEKRKSHVSINTENTNNNNKYSKRTYKIANDLNLEPTSGLERYCSDFYKQYSLKELTIRYVEWCSQNKKTPTILQWMNWVRREKEAGNLPKLGV